MSAPEAYADLAVAHDLVRSVRDKTRAQLEVYDPYDCAGAAWRHLAALGLANVRNQPKEFLAAVAERRVPAHDVLVIISQCCVRPFDAPAATAGICARSRCLF